MRLMWLCNMMPGEVRQRITGKGSGGGLWVDQVLSGLRGLGLTVRILCPGDGARGSLDDKCGFATFREGLPYVYLPELEKAFSQELEAFRPDVLHIWGTEYGHTLAMVRSAEAMGLLDRTVVSIQGLCSVYARHYAEGVPFRVQRGWTFRDLARRDNILRQQQAFARRGRLEAAALEKTRHVIGRTDWDRACVERISPKARYHFCNETLREPFYEGQWDYGRCRKHRIFASSCTYPVKGFHYLLEAFAEVVKDYPDATLAVPGKDPAQAGRLRRTNYQKYLAGQIRDLGLEGRVSFLGSLSAEQMKAAFLEANAFALPSTIENSPNSLGEAMLLGVPCVAADVGGVADLLVRGKEGFVYPSTAPYMLAYYLKTVFAMGGLAGQMGLAARAHAGKTHDPDKNLKNLTDIYASLI